MTDHDFSAGRPHPWHGLALGEDSPRIVNATSRSRPFDMIKYEIDKVSGYLRVDRPTALIEPSAGVVRLHPQDLLRDRVRKLAPGSETRDGDPLDICVVSERPIERSESSCGRA
jgi:inorganic pyrophosphatase